MPSKCALGASKQSFSKVVLASNLLYGQHWLSVHRFSFKLIADGSAPLFVGVV
jgi:hypothetical protein